MLSVVCALLLLELACSPSIARAQSLPPIACPQYFQYLAYGDFGYIGKITIPNLRIGRNRLDVKFVRHKALVDGYTGNLTLFESIDKTKENLAAGIPVMYRVDFPIDSEVPKLISLVVNGNEICAATTYSGDKQTLTMSNVMTTFETITRKIRPPLQITPQSGSRFDDPFAGILGPDSFERIPRPPVQLPDWRDLLPQPQLPDEPQPQRQPQPQPQPRPQPQPQSQPPQPESEPFSSRSLNEQCGILDNNYVVPFIYGGREVVRGEFPWLVAAFKKYATGTGFTCAGSLVSTRTVITAAHCFSQTPYTSIVVYVGKHNMDLIDEEGAEPRDLLNTIVHPNYNASFIADADLMILLLQRPVTFSMYVRPICLWPASEPTAAPSTRTSGYVAGWGADETGRKVTMTPKAVDISLVDNEQCLGTSGIYKRIRSLRTFCAGNEDHTGPCKGDSGSGLAMKHNNRWTLRGIVSAGQSEQEKCILDKYVIFCDVTKHLTWVRSNMLL